MTSLLAASARGLTKSFGRGDTTVHALRGVDLDLPAGRFTAIMGPSGSGKSTLMHCLAGLDQPSAGTVSVAGQPLESLGDDALTRFRRDHVGFVFQAFNLLPMLTAEQNIWLPTELAARPRNPDTQQRFAAIVETLGLTERLGHRPAELSGGQQQRVAIARALLAGPAIVFADEPTGNLDSTSSAEVLSLLRQSVRELGQTVVMVTHEIEAAQYADEIVVLADGRIVERREVAATEVAPLDDACCAPRHTHAGSVGVDRRATSTPHSAASPSHASRDARDAVVQGRDL